MSSWNELMTLVLTEMKLISGGLNTWFLQKFHVNGSKKKILFEKIGIIYLRFTTTVYIILKWFFSEFGKSCIELSARTNKIESCIRIVVTI